MSETWSKWDCPNVSKDLISLVCPILRHTCIYNPHFWLYPLLHMYNQRYRQSQPYHHVTMSGSVTVRKGVNSGLKRLSGAKPWGFLGKVASMVPKGGSLFLPFRASICKSCRQRTVARARFHIKSQKPEGSRQFWKITLANFIDSLIH